MSNTVPLCRFLFKQDWKVLNEVMRTSPFNGEDFLTSGELVTYLGTESACLVIVALVDKNDLVQIVTLMKQKSAVKNCSLKIVVVNFSGKKEFEKAIQKLGILDIVEANINAKALKFKIDFWMKSIAAQIKKNGTAELTTKSTKNTDSKTDEKKSIDQAQWQEPLECEDDIWLIKNEAVDCRRVLGKWHVRLLGPSPIVGHWAEVENRPNIWRFELKPESKEIFLPEQGSWYFHGDQKPDFVWKENRWLMTGNSFELFYRSTKNEHKTRIKLKDKVITLTKNSVFAKTKEQYIAETFDQELVVRKEAEGTGKTDVLGNENEIDANLEGKGSEADQIDGQLKGKSKGEGDIGADPLEGRGSNTKESGYWDGKNSKEEGISTKQEGAAAGKHNDGAQLDLENKNTKHKTHYKNHNEAEQFEANDKKNNQYGGKNNFKEKPLEDLKSPGLEHSRSGDQLSQEAGDSKHETHYQGRSPLDKSDSKERKEKEGQDILAKDVGGELDGKSSTDKFASHYKSGPEVKNKDLPELEKEDAGGERDRSKPSRLERPRSGDEEDNLNDIPLEKNRLNLERPSKEKDINDRPSGKGSTDKIDGQYRSRENEEGSRGPKLKPLPRSRGNDEEEGSDEGQKRGALPRQRKNDGDDDQAEDLLNDSPIDKDDNLNNLATNKRAPLDRPRSADNQDSREDAKVISIAETRQDRQSVATINQKLAEDLAQACENATLESAVTVDGHRVDCGLQDYFDETFIFSAEKSGIMEGSVIKLDMKFNYLNKDTILSIEGKITGVDREGDGSEQLTVEIDKSLKEKVDKFMTVYQTRQENINVFIKEAKGF